MHATVSDYLLQPGRIDVWRYPLHTLPSNALLVLNAEERLRAQRYYFEKHQRRFSAARATMRAIIARYSGINADRLVFEQNSYGKPHLVNQPTLQFNLSHAGDWALLAIGFNNPMGVDLEWFSSRPYMGIARNVFSIHEQKALCNAHRSLKPFLFFHIWAQKEAFIKACGLGLSYPTQTFDVPTEPATRQIVFDPLHNQTWQMASFMPFPMCCAALCHHPSITEIRYPCLSTIHDLLIPS